jgi:hypothetical protein
MSVLDEELQDELKEVFDYKEHLININHLKNKSQRYRQGKEPKGYKMGIPIIDDIIVMKPKEMHACTGKKGRGKTTIQQIFFLCWAMANDLTCVLALQENEQSLEVNRFLGYCLGENPNDVEKNNPELFKKVESWFYDHFIFIEVDTLKQAVQVVEGLIENGKKVDLLFCDPVNSFESGYSDTGNSHKDDKITAMNMLKFTKKCSLFVSQHPTMSGQRSEEDVNSYSAEGGYFLNKSHFTWAINRDNGSNFNRISVDNVRNSYTGADVTHKDYPLLIEWGKYSINAVYYEKIGYAYDFGTPKKEYNIIQQIRKKFNPFEEVFTEDLPNFIEQKPTPTASYNEAFGNDEPEETDIPF